MATINITLSIDSSNQLEMDALTALLGQLNPNSVQTVAESKTINLGSKKGGSEASDKNIFKKKNEEAAKKEEVVEQKVEADPTEETKANVSITEIREVLATKVNDNRAEIKKQLTAMGASSVTTLEEKHYDSFYEFLQAL